MILANVAAAETLEKVHQALIYRAPRRADIREAQCARRIPRFDRHQDRQGSSADAAPVQRHPGASERHRAREHRQRCRAPHPAQAEYVAENYGHFGLHLRRYAHFTSPIRRYADLIVHRGLIRALRLGNDGLPDMTGEQLAEIAAQISATERRAMAAERETVDRLIAQFLSERVGATFQGRISGVTGAGLFVKLAETGADGFIPIATLGDDYFNHDESFACVDWSPQRRDASPWRRNCGEARRSGAFCRRSAV